MTKPKTVPIELVETVTVKGRLRLQCPSCKKQPSSIEDWSLVDYNYHASEMDDKGEYDIYDSESGDVRGVSDVQCGDCGTSLVIWPKKDA